MNTFVWVVGASLGSFCHVVSYRMFKNESFISGRSYCEHCHHTLGGWDLIPIVSYFLLRGRCRYCNEKISFKHVLVEAIMAAVTFVIYQIVGLNSRFIFVLGMTMLLFIISLMDLQTMEVNGNLIFSLFLISIVYHLYFHNSLFLSLINALIVMFPLVFLRIITSAIGQADIELFAINGWLCGIKSAIFTFYISVGLALIYGLYLVIFKNKSKKTMIPFCPFISVGFFFSLLLFL